MATIAFLGLGAMGSRMAAHLIAAGHTVRIWNRSPEKAAPLLQAGAEWSETPAKAAAGADSVLAMVRDDIASRAVWLDPITGALSAMTPQATAVECSTLSLPWVKTLAAAATSRGINFLDAPVVGSRPQADQRQLIFLVGGTETTVGKMAPILQTMGSILHHLGPNGSGAITKLAVNALFGIQVAALAEIIPMITAHIDAPARAVEALIATPAASPAAKAAATSMLSQGFPPLFPVEIVEKDFGYAAEAAAQAPMIAATRAVFQRAIAAGFGADNLTGIIRLYAPAASPPEKI